MVCSWFLYGLTVIMVMVPATQEAVPSWVKKPQSFDGTLGGRAVFYCEVNGDPEPSIEWMLNGAPISELDANPYRVVDNTKLTFSNLSYSDAIAIQCKATNKHGYILADASLEIPMNMPPIIVKQAPKVAVFRVGESVQLPCEATGGGTPITYRWLKTDKDFQPSGDTVMQPFVGTLYFTRLTANDEAIYQCIAETAGGTAFSVNTTYLRQAVLESFPPIPVRKHRPNLGQSLTLQCGAPDSYPKPTVFWAIDYQDGATQPLILNDRITQDPEGNLHFANVVSEDEQSGNSYVCVVMNSFLDITQKGSYKRIIPQGDEIQTHNTALMYSDLSNQVALRGQTWTVKCIFSGSPTPQVSWIRQRVPMPSRMNTSSSGQEMVIGKIELGDAGRYECDGRNNISTPIRRSFSLTVESVPFWVKKPQSIDGTEEGNAVFYCDTGGSPAPHNSWFLNGVPISTVEADPRRVVEPMKLTIYNLAKNDAMVIQCNATNKHGYVFANAYLTVWSEPAFIQEPPIDGQRATEGKGAMLRCTVIGSPKPKVVWHKGQEPLTGGRFTVQENGHLYIRSVTLADTGSYTCTVTNKYDTVSATGSMVVGQGNLCPSCRPKECNNSTQCYADFEVCDGHPHCEDGTDELNCENTKVPDNFTLCKGSERKCDNGNCIPCHHLCDEDPCLAYNPFKCGSKEKCLPQYKICDNIDDCMDASDEQNCENVTCALYNFRKCKLTHKCLHLQYECDGIEDCEDGSDEWNCTTITKKSPRKSTVWWKYTAGALAVVGVIILVATAVYIWYNKRNTKKEEDPEEDKDPPLEHNEIELKYTNISNGGGDVPTKSKHKKKGKDNLGMESVDDVMVLNTTESTKNILGSSKG